MAPDLTAIREAVIAGTCTLADIDALLAEVARLQTEIQTLKSQRVMNQPHKPLSGDLTLDKVTFSMKGDL